MQCPHRARSSACRLVLKRLRTSSAFADMVQDEESFPKLQILDLA
jgi:hypothetical protein